MTCIVGIATGEKVWIGADSAGVAGLSITVRADAKVFTNGPMLFGFTSSFRMGQLLRHALTVPKQFSGVADDAWLCTTFIDAVRKCLKDGGFARAHSGVESGGCFLVGYRGRLYEVDSDFQVGDPVDQYAAVGCGEQFALGSLHASTGEPESRIMSALAAAAHFSAGVCEPFTVLEGGAR
jgi:ATP-dependent protease HslVU (ClpYQ) peptidase subunit